MKFIRSSIISLKENNHRKQLILLSVIEEYSRVCNLFIKQFWKKPITKAQLLKEVVNSIPSWLSARMRKVAAREAIDLVSSAKALKGNCPKHSGRKMHLSSTICSLKESKQSKEFDAWIHLSSVGYHPTYGKIILDLPIRFHKHFNKLKILGKRLESYIISKDSVQLCFKIETEEKREPTRCLGIDSGIKSLASTSTSNQYGLDIEKAVKRVSRCKPGSKGRRRAKRALRQRMDEVAKEIFDKEDPTLIVVEKLKNLNKGSKVRRRLTKNVRRVLGSWAYAYWLGRLQRESETRRSSFRSVSPYKTSQRCSVCGHTEKRNRSKENFRCRKCDHRDNADINAARNILDRFLAGPYGAGCKPLLPNFA